MTHTFTLIPGDGIGPEVSAAVVRILQTAGRARTRDLGGDATTTSFTDAICKAIEAGPRNGIWYISP